jgi:hypothetical protein
MIFIVPLLILEKRMMKSSWLNRDRITGLAIALILLIGYAYVFPRWADPNVNSRMDMIAAVVDRGTLQIDAYVQNTVDFAKIGNHYYSDKPPGPAFLGIPIYAGLKLLLEAPLVNQVVEKLSTDQAFQATLRAGGSGVYLDKVRFAIAQVVLTWLLAVLPTIFLVLLMYKLLRKMGTGVGTSAFTVLAYGLLTPAFAYADAYYSHQLSAALLFAAFYLAYDKQKVARPGVLAGIGFLLGYAVIGEYPVVLIAGILFLYTLFRLKQLGIWRKIIWVILPGLVIMAGWMVYNTAVFGGPLHIGYDYSTDWAVQHHTGFMSLTMPHLDAAWGITFGVFRGLFVLSPILLLALPGFFAWWKQRVQRPEWWVAIAIVISMYVFNASSIMWWGGFAIGPRYILAAFPFLALALAFAVSRWSRNLWFKALASILCLWSLVATWGLTLAGQAFPSDVIQNPLLEYALPNWLAGDIARNAGTILGLQGPASLLPMIVAIFAILFVWWLGVMRVQRAEPATAPLLGTKQAGNAE